MSFPENDVQFEEVKIAGVEGAPGKGWGIQRDDGWCFGVPADSPVEPRVGMTARFYGSGIGGVVRGLFLDGIEIFYRSERQQRIKELDDLAASERKQREGFEVKRENFDKRFQTLPAVFRRRLLKFRRNNPDFRWKYEQYELFVCEEAVKIAGTMKTAARVREFSAMDFRIQRQHVPCLSDQHSGNTFGMAVKLAYLYLSEPENVVRVHGALAMLVGSEEYGCVPRSAA